MNDNDEMPLSGCCVIVAAGFLIGALLFNYNRSAEPVRTQISNRPQVETATGPTPQQITDAIKGYDRYPKDPFEGEQIDWVVGNAAVAFYEFDGVRGAFGNIAEVDKLLAEKKFRLRGVIRSVDLDGKVTIGDAIIEPIELGK